MRGWFSGIVVTLGCWLGVAHAQAPTTPEEIFEQTREELQAELPGEDQAEIDRRLAALDAKLRKKKARAMVLQWPDAPVDEKDPILQALARNRMGRPGAKFYPEVDLYQEGRRRMVPGMPDSALLDQPGRVPDEELVRVEELVAKARRRLGASLDDRDLAEILQPYADDVWFIDRPKVREVLFDLYMTIGQARSETEKVPPYYRLVGAQSVNYYLYLAAAMLWEEEQLGITEGGLSDRLAGSPVAAQVRRIMGDIDNRFHPPIPVAFHEGGFFDPKKFAREYKVMINGLERFVDETGMVMVPRGRVDISLERTDGFGLSESLEVVRLDEKIYFAVEVAQQKLGYDMIDQLMQNPSECAPYLRDDTRANLATYAALHPDDEIYLVIPYAGSPYDLYIWRYERPTGELKLLIDRNKGFPVRFALLSGVGLAFNGASLSTDPITGQVPTDPSAVQGGAARLDTTRLKQILQPDPSSIPIDFQFRGHFNRLMFGFGMQFGANIVDGVWADEWQVDDDQYVGTVSEDGDLTGPGGADFVPGLREREWQRLLYAHLGVVLLRNAAYGYGPRGYLRVGWMNVPHAIELSGHIGYTTDATFGKKKEYKGRVVGLLDADLFGGMFIPFGRTLFRNGDGKPQLMPNFGFTAGGGFTF